MKIRPNVFHVNTLNTKIASTFSLFVDLFYDFSQKGSWVRDASEVCLHALETVALINRQEIHTKSVKIIV